MYELWWRGSLNVTAVFSTEREALAALREAPDEHSREYVAGFTLERLDQRSNRTAVAAGSFLLDLVEAGRPLA